MRRHWKGVEGERGEYRQSWDQVCHQVGSCGGKPLDSFHGGEVPRVPGLLGGGHLQRLHCAGPPLGVQGWVGKVQKGEPCLPPNPTLQLVLLQRRSNRGLVDGRRWKREENEVLGRWPCWHLGDHRGSDSKKLSYLPFMILYTLLLQVVYRDGTGYGSGSTGTGYYMKCD